ncbi:5'-nucleotidase, lipoprotein e(P4) family [Consotaella salsifontis]|uniref:Acid phosphatase n=1 Tax=Consotaella salsifontis TaxID=1365950 RepID=A0A1T4NYR7_9HYPH|nr:5'-nucleotidase, lipoprotein e(P4) family [Consotaella salsifontis]SJZ83848.1 acid phosphatase [Consotaella salsifontis]
MKRHVLLAALGAAALAMPSLASAEDKAAEAATGPNDLLNATLWMQTSVEYKANSMAVYALAKLRLDEALADKSASALDQKDAGDLPPAIILDLDETVMDNSAYEAGLITSNTDFSSKTWTEWTDAKEAKEVPGALDYIKYADSKGVKVFYVSNRTSKEEAATRDNMEAMGFPMGGNVDVFLTKGEKDDWKSDKETRRQYVVKDYRVIAMVGDNFSDFTSKGGSIEDRAKAFDELKDHFTKDWFMLANPTYGSWESSAFGDNYKLSNEERRAMKVKALDGWTSKAPAK